MTARDAAPVGREASHQGGLSTCLTRISSPCPWTARLAQRLCSRRNGAWRRPAGLRPPEPSDLKSLLGVRLVGVMVLQPGVGESELEPVQFDPSAQASHHPSRVAQGGEMPKVTGLLFSRSS